MGKGGGKTGKLIWSAIGFALGAAFLGPIAGTVFKAGLMGASLFGTIWMALNKNDPQEHRDGSTSVARFGRSQETMSSGGAIPVVYGLRKISGNQTYHLTNADANTLHKHVVLCEGGIQGVQGVTANDLLIPGNGLNSKTVFTIQNVKYVDAQVWISNKTLYLYCNGKTKSIYLCNKDDFMGEEDKEFWEWQTSIPALISYINRLNQGWQCFPIATTCKYPGDLSIAYGNVKYDEHPTLPYKNNGDGTTDWVNISPLKKGEVRSGSALIDREPNTYIRAATKSEIWQWEDPPPEWPGNFNDHLSVLIKYVMFSTGSHWDYEKADGTCWRRQFYSDFQPTIQSERWEDHQWLIMWRQSSSAYSCYKNPAMCIANTVTGGTKYTFHDGSLPSNYGEVGAYPSMAWIDMTCCVSDELSGNPSVSCEVLGKKIYDTRTYRTAYSTNPAMCLRDFLLSPVYGLGNFVSKDDLDEDSFKEAADYCDEVIEFQASNDVISRAKRYELNIVIDSRRNAWDWVSDILASFSGFLVITQGKLMLKIERPSPIVYAFDESNCSELKIAPIELEQVPNRYEVTFIDPLNNWDSVKAIVEDTADQHTRGKIITKDVQLEGVTSQNQALRLARFYRDYNASCIINVSFKTGYQAMHLQPGDVVKLTYKCFADFPLRINEIREDANGGFEITGRQYNPTLYNDTLGAPIKAYNYATRDVPLGVIPEITGLTFKQYFYTDANGVKHKEIQGIWTAPFQYDFVKEFAVYKLENNQWNQLLRTTNTSFKTNVTVGDSMKFKICVVNTNDELSSGIESDTIYINGRDTIPDSVTGLSVIYDDDKLHISWNENIELDLKQYVLTVNGETFTTTDTFAIVSPVDGVNNIAIKAEDYAENKSDEASTTIQLSLVPAEVNGFKAENAGNYIALSWLASEKATRYEITGSISKTVYGSCSLLIPITSTGLYSYRIKAVNKYGASNVSTTSITVSSIEERNTIMTVNLLQGLTCDDNCHIAKNGVLVSN